MYAVDVFKARGHELIKADHRGTLEITKDDYLTEKGNCIVAINSEKACDDLKEEVKNLIRMDGSKVRVTLQCEGIEEVIEGYGSSKLTLKDNRSIVLRKSSYIDQRTLVIRADKAAFDLSRDFVRKIRNRDVVILVKIGVFI